MEFWDQPGVESIKHYVMFNAGTRYFALYPEVLVLEDSDLSDLPGFFERLTMPPFSLRFSLDCSASQYVRRLTCGQAKPGSLSRLPFSHPEWLSDQRDTYCDLDPVTLYMHLEEEDQRDTQLRELKRKRSP